jgi:para-aminobenzoate synthetase component 1
MTICRFDNASSGRGRALYGLCGRIEVRSAAQLPEAMAAIAASQRRGHWTALLLDYGLGAWLEPALLESAASGAGMAGLTALVFERCQDEPAWGPLPGVPPAAVTAVRPRIACADYRAQVERILDGIAAGNFYQVNYTFPLDVTFDGSPESLYRTVLGRHPSAHAAYIADPDGGRHILSFSPELFLCREGARLVTRPMKGTAPRHDDAELDRRAAEALRSSPKNRAENSMIVDLLRNDLGRIARTGTVKVEKLLEVECYPSIWTMTSTLSADVGAASLHDVLRALFPCGSVTGAPKIAAMRCIRDLEPAPRGLYCGSIGWLAPNGDFSLNVAIRTLVVDEPGHGVYGVGGGIVHDSDPAQEWQECQWKARILGAPFS